MYCLFKSLLRLTPQVTSMFHITGLSWGESTGSFPHKGPVTWWRHQMETFSALLAIRAGNSPVPGEFPAQRPVTQSFDVFFDLRLNKWLSKQSWGWWFETLSHPLWHHLNDAWDYYIIVVSGNAESISLLWRHNAIDTLSHAGMYNRQYTPLYSPSRGLVQFQWQHLDVSVNVPMERQVEFNGYIWFEIWMLIK